MEGSVSARLEPEHGSGIWGWAARLIDRLSNALGTFSAYLMVFAAIITTYDAIMRTVFRHPSVWVFEITGYILIWYGFLTASYGLKSGSHINVDVLVGKMKDAVKLPLDVVNYVITFLYSAILTYFTFSMFVDAIATKEVSPTILHIPVYIIQLGMLVGVLLLALQSLSMLIAKIKTLIRGRLERGAGPLNNPAIVLPIYVALCAFGLYLYIVSPGLGIIVSMVLLLLGGLPVFSALGFVGAVGLFLLLGVGTGLPQTAFVAFGALDNFVLLAIPMYVMAGQILVSAGIAKELYDACATWVGHLPGGIAVATVVACGIFAAISGSSVATAAAIGLVALPEMLKRGYDKNLAFGVLAAGGTLGILIPPSGAMIVYSSITDVSAGRLFVGGIVPGIILVIIFAAYAMIYCVRTGRYQRLPRAPWRARISVLKDSFWGLMTPVIIIVTIYTGLCTPTEAAAIAIVYSIIISLARRSIRPKELTKIIRDSNSSSTMILMIIVGSMVLGAITTLLQVPQNVLTYVSSLGLSKWAVLAIVTAIYILLGMFLEVYSTLMITIPIVYPLIISLGFNGIWFGIFVTILMEFALITPPVGLNIYVIQGIGNASMADVVKGVWPFIIMLTLGLLLITVFPQLALYLPGIM